MKLQVHGSPNLHATIHHYSCLNANELVLYSNVFIASGLFPVVPQHELTLVLVYMHVYYTYVLFIKPVCITLLLVVKCFPRYNERAVDIACRNLKNSSTAVKDMVKELIYGMHTTLFSAFQCMFVVIHTSVGMYII